MIEKRTVFILGAGASCPYGFPTATDLRRQILSDFEDRYVHFLDRAGKDTRVARIINGYPDLWDVKGFLQYFGLSTTPSVDLFLARNPRFESIGKIAICLTILHAEKYSNFREQAEKPEQDWHRYLYDRLTHELTAKDSFQEFHRNTVAFVTFNYDRSLEHFLFESLLNSFEDADTEKVREQLAQVPIIHVYGRPATLPWQELDARRGLDYGKNIDDLSLVNVLGLIDNIRIVHEKQKRPELDSAREEISKAGRIFFLGFGYAKENLEAIGFPPALRAEQNIYGTAMGYTPGEIQDIEQNFLTWLSHSGASNFLAHKQIRIRDCDCVHLLREFL